VQKDRQGHDAVRFQLDEAVVTDQPRKRAPQVLTDVRVVKGLEVALARLLKEDDDGHHFTQAQTAGALPLDSLRRE
jgi:hypothetical protein